MGKEILSPEFVSDVIQHMNSDHVASLQDYLVAFQAVSGAVNPQMTDLSVSGFELEYQSLSGVREKVWIKFGREISRPEQVRGALVALAKRARSDIAESE